MSKILIGIVYALSAISFIGTLSLLHYFYEKKKWNNGSCKCGGKFIFVGKDYEHDCRWYICDKCKKQIDLTWIKGDDNG